MTLVLPKAEKAKLRNFQSTQSEGDAKFISTRSHSSHSGKSHAPRTFPVSVSWSICHRRDFARRMCLATLALSPPGPYADPAYR